jgi:hypothetical protein
MPDQLYAHQMLEEADTKSAIKPSGCGEMASKKDHKEAEEDRKED